MYGKACTDCNEGRHQGDCQPDTTTQGDEQIQTKGVCIHPKKDRYKQIEEILKPYFYGKYDVEMRICTDKLAALFQSNQPNIGFLRQFLNEDRITDSSKMVTNEEIEYMLGVEPDKTLERVRELIEGMELDGYVGYNRALHDVLAILEAEQKGKSSELF
jgi:hypothetical protein